MRIKNSLPDWACVTLALYAALLSSQVLSNPPDFLWLPLSDLREKERVLVTFTYFYKCWKSKRDNAFYGKDECTGQCRTEDCVYINIDDDLRRCCEGTSGCDTQCPDRKALITSLSVGLGTPVLLVCICVVLIAWDDDNFVEDTCSAAYRGVGRLLDWTGRGVSTLVGYCARCPECCARQLSALVGYGGDQGNEVPDVVVTAEPSGIDVEMPELPDTPSPEESSFISPGPPSYDEVVKVY